MITKELLKQLKNRLSVGDWVTVDTEVTEETNGRTYVTKGHKKVMITAMYPHIFIAQHKNGREESFTYADLVTKNKGGL